MAGDPEKTGRKEGRDEKGRFLPGVVQAKSPGRPEGSVSLVSALKRRLRENPAEIDEILKGLIDGAKNGDTSATKILLDRIDGPVKEKVELTGAEGGPIVVRLAVPSNGSESDDSAD